MPKIAMTEDERAVVELEAAAREAERGRYEFKVMVENDANDRLRAAAPLLLKCLEDMVAASNHSAAWERAKAAIAQAKGEKE